MSPQGNGGSHPHFLFGLAEKKTGRARSKRKDASCPTLTRWVKVGQNAGAGGVGAVETWGPSTGCAWGGPRRSAFPHLMAWVHDRGWKTDCPYSYIAAAALLHRGLAGRGSHCEPVLKLARQSVLFPCPLAACGRPPPASRGEGRGGARAPRPTEGRGTGRASPAPAGGVPKGCAGADTIRPPLAVKDGDGRQAGGDSVLAL